MARIYSKNNFISTLTIKGLPKGKDKWNIGAEGNVVPKDVLDTLLKDKETPSGIFFNEMVDRGKYLIEQTSTDNKKIDSSKAKDNAHRIAIEIQNMTVKEARKVITGDPSNEEDHGLLDITVLKAIQKIDVRTGVQNYVQKQIDLLFEREDEE